MPETNRQLLLNALTAKNRYVGEMLRRANVAACGVGYKIKGDTLTDELAVIVSVVKKLPAAQLTASDIVPPEVDGIKTDVIETGAFQAQQTPRDHWRPTMPPGISIGHIDATAGTLGCLVRRGEEVFILSNNHVLANCNMAQPGDPILQPGRHDGGRAEDRIATLSEYIPLDFGSETPSCTIATTIESGLNWLASALGSRHRLAAYQQTTGTNWIDAALARPDDPEAVTPDILGIGRPLGIHRAGLGTMVKKSGRTTGYTEGRIIQVDVTSQVSYIPGDATFQGQMMATNMSQPGDSGSAVLDTQNYVVGLLFAGSDVATLINPIESVLEALKVEIAT
jgi:hypothetical protein